MKQRRFLEDVYRGNTTGQIFTGAPVTRYWSDTRTGIEVVPEWNWSYMLCYRITFTGYFNKPYEHLFWFYANPLTPPYWQEFVYRPYLTVEQIKQAADKRLDELYIGERLERGQSLPFWNVKIEEIENPDDLLKEIFPDRVSE